MVVKEYSVLELQQGAVQERQLTREWCRCMVSKQPERQRAGCCVPGRCGQAMQRSAPEKRCREALQKALPKANYRYYLTV